MPTNYLHSERKIGTSGVPDLATTWRYDQTEVLDEPLTKYGRPPKRGGDREEPEPRTIEQRGTPTKDDERCRVAVPEMPAGILGLPS